MFSPKSKNSIFFSNFSIYDRDTIILHALLYICAPRTGIGVAVLLVRWTRPEILRQAHSGNVTPMIRGIFQVQVNERNFHICRASAI